MCKQDEKKTDAQMHNQWLLQVSFKYLSSFNARNGPDTYPGYGRADLFSKTSHCLYASVIPHEKTLK